MRHGKIHRRMAGGPRQRINLLRHFITALVKYERMEAPHAKAHETQKYAERLINIAKRGDTDEEAMKIANFWLYDKRQVHKLFKVLAPRFKDYKKDYTQLLRVPGYQGINNVQTAFLEFHGNPYPPLRPIKKKNPNWILNVLIQEAVKDLKLSGMPAMSSNKQTLSASSSNDETLQMAASQSDSTDIDQLEVAMDNIQLGTSHEGAVADKSRIDGQKDGTPV